ncbi:MAG: YdeI/OmpD-associated family protein [Desulfuromonadaceae bacterium]|nr:YdeI/OmpD-associated family protein [Desulfuromonadaceae bacterium]MDD5105638.1 YdeI/OmpD-associated family protein [Desulfuromonadaceae bacterium]
MADASSRLKRPIYPIPDFVLSALEKRNLMAAYRQRPPYQQNDYIGWISRAKLPATQQKRLAQMLDELERGGVYMKMKWSAHLQRQLHPA